MESQNTTANTEEFMSFINSTTSNPTNNVNSNSKIEVDMTDGTNFSSNTENNNNEVIAAPPPVGTAASASSGFNTNSGRQLTFKDFGERMKDLEGENFQLKVRIHLMEQSRFGKSWRNSNSHNEQQNTSARDAGLTTATNEIVTQFQQLKKINETQRQQLLTLENRYKQLEAENREFLEREEALVARNEDLNDKLDVLDRELNLMKWKREEDDDIEKCFKAFTNGGVNNSSNSTKIQQSEQPTIEQNNILLRNIEEQKILIQDLKDENESLKLEISTVKHELVQKTIENGKLTQKAKKKEEQMEKAENNDLNSKFITTCLTMREMGHKINELKNQNNLVEDENEELKQNLAAQSTAVEQISKVNAELVREKASLCDKLAMSEKLHHEYSKLVRELKSLRTVCPVDESYERFVNTGLKRSVSHQEIREDPSPDLGIETDQEAIATSTAAHHVASHDTVMLNRSSHFSKPTKHKHSFEDNRDLRSINTELANKLKVTKQALEKTLHKLDKTKKEKEDFEKAICRQLHRTHIILQEAQADAALPTVEGNCISKTNATACQQEDQNNFPFAFTQKC